MFYNSRLANASVMSPGLRESLVNKSLAGEFMIFLDLMSEGKNYRVMAF